MTDKRLSRTKKYLSKTREELTHLRAVQQALTNSNIAILYQSIDLKYLWSENLPPLLQSRWSSNINDLELFPEMADLLTTFKQRILRTGYNNITELTVGKGRDKRWYECHCDCDLNEHNEITGIITTLIDISELKRREETLRILLREVSHRSKNLLAIIQGIANQTARFTATNTEFIKKFSGRLLSLSQSQDLVTDSNWLGALFRDLARSQISKYIDPSDNRLTIKGDNPYLFPSATLHLGLALHELIINSTSYGALSHGSGRVEVSAKVEKIGDDKEELTFIWEELCPDVLTCEKLVRRFGSVVLEQIVPSSVDGTASHERKNSGFVYTLKISNDYFDS